MDKRVGSDWKCIGCGFVLGKVLGGELHPSVHGSNTRTAGPNLVVTCPECGSIKTFYTSDPVVRAIYQLLNATSAVAAESIMKKLSEARRNDTL